MGQGGGTGYKWAERLNVIGKRATSDIEANELILPNQIQ